MVKGGTAPLTATPFTWASFTSGSVAIALLFNFASFIGFEATTIYSEEARDPKRTVPRATYVAVLTIGVFYTLTTYLMVEGQGAAGLQEYLGGLQPDPTAFLFALGSTYIGAALTTVMSLLFISSVFAALLAFHNAVARYLFALGREFTWSDAAVLPERIADYLLTTSVQTGASYEISQKAAARVAEARGITMTVRTILADLESVISELLP